MDNQLMACLRGIYMTPRRLQSDFCRGHSYEVARLASCGLITTSLGDDFGHNWRVTLNGLRVLELYLGEDDA